ncbi:MAG: right-handed parallel beta-helix repeat-containing protein [Pseudomonadota bacterium]
MKIRLSLCLLWFCIALLLVPATGAAPLGDTHDTHDILATDDADGTALSIATNYGAATPITTYEAEDAKLVHTNGSDIGNSRAWGQISSEASGRQAISLAAEQHLQFNLKAAAQGLTLRYSIPDSADGSAYSAGISLYIDGKFKRQILLTNKFSWIYGVWDSESKKSKRWTNNPKAKPNNAHRFFDEVSVLLDQSYPVGTQIKLLREDTNTSSGTTSIVIDLIETEAVPAALSQPPDYVAITSYGAIADDRLDDTAAMKLAIAAVKNSGGLKKGVWLPTGSFDFDIGTAGNAWSGSGSRIYLDAGISLKGAGMWRTTLQGAFAGIYAKGGNISISDIKIRAADTLRDDDSGVPGIEGNLSNSSVDRVWIQHNKVGIWVTRSFSQSGTVSKATIRHVRIRDVWADGINFHYGTSNSSVSNSSIRNTGDDGLAMWSDTFTNTGNSFHHNTVQLPGLANGIAIYGGKDNTVSFNVVEDIVDNGAGIAFGTDFNPPVMSGRLTISHNILNRCGSFHHDWATGIGAIWAYWHKSKGKLDNLFVELTGNQIKDSSYAGVLIEQPSNGASMRFMATSIVNPGTVGIDIRSSAAGTARFEKTTVTGALSDALINKAAHFVVSGIENAW